MLWFDGWMNYYAQINNSRVDGEQSSDKQLLGEMLESKLNSDSDGSLPQINVFSNSYLQNEDSILTKDGDSHLQNEDSILTKNVDSSSVIIEQDSSQIIPDSLKPDIRMLDSTARLSNLKYKPKDVPYISLYSRKPSRIFVSPSPTVKKRVVEIDSSGNFVQIKEKIGDQVVKIILEIPIQEYIELMIKTREQVLWDELAYKYELKDSKKGLGDLIKDITDFEIPLPSVGILSIFGTPKINLKIGGSVDIHGAWRNETTEGLTASRLGNTRNEPDFRQQVQINVNGTIGDKLQISADWNTERNFEYENQLKIKYTGYEDEIVQVVEAGNVSLQTSPLVGGGEALFGIKSQFKLGPLNLTVLASQKKGEIKEKTLSGGTSTNTYEIRPYKYSRNHYFLDAIYADTTEGLNIFNKYYGNPTPIDVQQYFVRDIEVWKSINQTLKSSNERNAVAYLNLPQVQVGQRYNDSLRTNAQEVEGEIAVGRFILLTKDVDYILNDYTGFITFKSSLQESDVIAVAYRFGRTGNENVYGEFMALTQQDTAKRIVLKLVKPKNLLPQYKKAWSLMLKNIYPSGGRNINREGFEFDIKYEVDGQEAQNVIGETRLLNAFGLDKLDQSGSTQPDGLFDYKPGVTVYPETGEIIFPYLQPFGLNMPKSIPDYVDKRFMEVYDTTLSGAQNNKVKDKFIMYGKYTGSASSVYPLGFTIVENSVKVTLNGRELTAGSDYFVDYNIGQLTIRNDAALVPGANLKITYEENDLFQLASKTLFGVRGEFDISRKTKLGFSALTLSQQTLSDKVRIGEEPLSNSIYGLDFSTGADLPFLTRLLDNVISTREMSSMSFRGDFAYINPDPNTKKSTIASDKGKSIAYIDDFEGTKRIIPIGISYTGWKDASIPSKLDSLNGMPSVPDSLKMNYKGKSFWFNVLPSDVYVNDIWQDKKVARGDEQVTVLDYVFMPSRAGAFNRNLQKLNLSHNWGGIMKTLSSTASNLVDENIEFIEFWINRDTLVANSSVYDNAKIFIDLGKVSEDVIPNNFLDTEDKNGNDLVENGEDNGLDGLTDAQEKTLYSSTAQDPNNDNFSLRGTDPRDIMNYYSINGTEGNAALTDIGRFPDTEDLNRNGNLDQLNSFFRYEIPLKIADNPYISGGSSAKGWFLYRIPLKDFKDKIGSPSFSVVEYIRFFVTNVDTTVRIRLAELNLVGNQWQKKTRDDEIVTISVVNVEDNPNYTSPPGVQREQDRTRPDQDILRNEQSLNLIVDGLAGGENREILKYLYRPLDVFNYSEMKLFVHGDVNGKIAYSDESQNPAKVYFRFGTDSNNYYEYRQPIIKGWNEISILFSELTAIKQLRDSITQDITPVPVAGLPNRYYYLKGNPNLTSLRFFSIVIENQSNPADFNDLFGEVWVNELRVIGADDSPGWAYSFATSLKLADLLSVSFNMSETSPYFHRLQDRFGSRVESKNWGVSADLDVLKLLPFDMYGSNLKINYSRTESVGSPVFLPGTDIKINEAAQKYMERLMNPTDTTAVPYSEVEAQGLADQLKEDAKTVSTSDNWSSSGVKLKIPIEHWLIRDSFNSLTYGFNYNKTFARNPSTQSNISWIWNANVNYAVNLSPDYFFYPVNIPVFGSALALFSDYRNAKIYYTPQSFSWTVSAKRSRGANTTRQIGNALSRETISRDFTASRGLNIGWKITEGGLLNLSTSYSFDITSSLTYLEVDFENNQRRESVIWKEILSGQFFGKDYQFRQSFDLRTSPRLPSFWDLNKFFTLTTGYNVSYQWRNDFSQAELGRQSGYGNKVSLGLTLRLKALSAPLFAESDPAKKSTLPIQPKPQEGRGRTRDFDSDVRDPNTIQSAIDSIQKSRTELEKIDIVTELDTIPQKPSALANALFFLKTVSKTLFFDYETINVNFSNDNSFNATGLYGQGTGLSNFWSYLYSAENGASRSFMLGLSNNPGLRAANGNLTDVYSQKNNLDFKTSRPLWEGAKIDLNWKVGWSVNKSTNLQSDQDGNTIITNINSTGTIDRSFFSLPSTAIFSVFKSGIKTVNELYDANSPNPTENLSDAFISGFETLPLGSRLGFLSEFSKFIPRPNWRISWDGLEKLTFLKSYTKRVSLDHGYQSSYTEGWKINPDGKQAVQTQKISYGFSPLLGVNLTFNELWAGNLSGSVKYSTRSNFDLSVTTKNITEVYAKDVGITLNYSKSGFEIPLFGLSLKNDIEFSFSYTNTKNSTVVFDMANFNEEGTPQDGTTRIVLEPRIKYVISSRVTLTLFYKRATVEPEGAARIPPSTINEMGLDVRILIQ